MTKLLKDALTSIVIMMVPIAFIAKEDGIKSSIIKDIPMEEGKRDVVIAEIPTCSEKDVENAELRMAVWYVLKALASLDTNVERTFLPEF